MRKELDSIEWDKLPCFAPDDHRSDKNRVEEMWKSLLKVLTDLISRYVPRIKSGGKPRKGDFPIPLDLNELIKQKNHFIGSG